MCLQSKNTTMISFVNCPHFQLCDKNNRSSLKHMAAQLIRGDTFLKLIKHPVDPDVLPSECYCSVTSATIVAAPLRLHSLLFLASPHYGNFFNFNEVPLALSINKQNQTKATVNTHRVYSKGSSSLLLLFFFFLWRRIISVFLCTNSFTPIAN